MTTKVPETLEQMATLADLVRFHGGTRADREAVDTGMIDPYRETFEAAFSDPAAAAQLCPLGRMGTPDEAADAMFFLALATYCNGSVLIMDGGSSA